MTSYPQTKPVSSGGATAGSGSDSLGGKLGETAGQVKEQTGKARERVASQAIEMADKQKSTLTEHGKSLKDEMSSTAKRLREGGNERPAMVAEKVSDQLETGIQYIDSKSVSEMLDDARQLARKSPAAFVGVLFGAGFLVSRLFKADKPANETNEYWNTPSTRPALGTGSVPRAPLSTGVGTGVTGTGLGGTAVSSGGRIPTNAR